MIESIKNPLKTLSKEELYEFRKAIAVNFSTKTDENGVLIEDYSKFWNNLYSKCVKYCHFNYQDIIDGYPENNERTYADLVQILISKQINKR
jgi:hypothetical protein